MVPLFGFDPVSFFRRTRRVWLAGGVLVVFAAVTYFVQFRSASIRAARYSNQSVLQDYRKQLQDRPFDGSLLLRSARHHYHYVRHRRVRNRRRPAELRTTIEHALRQYRRIEADDEWNLEPKDFFYNAYLYYQLGPAYNDRARETALKAYELGYRSPELTALLGNVHYRSGDYEVALNYYRSLGENPRDPVIVYNKARTLRALQRLGEAEELFQRGKELFDSGGWTERELGRRFQMSLISLALDRKNFLTAQERIKEFPPRYRNARVRVLYARSLIGLGHTSRARAELEEITNGEDYPREAKELLERLSESSSG